MQCRTRHDKAELFTGGVGYHMQVLPGPVMGLQGIHGNSFLLQQLHQMGAGRATRGEQGGSLSAEVRDGAGDVDTATTGFKHRRQTAQFSFRIYFCGAGRGVQ